MQTGGVIQETGVRWITPVKRDLSRTGTGSPQPDKLPDKYIGDMPSTVEGSTQPDKYLEAPVFQ